MRLNLLAAAIMGVAITAPACALAATEIESYTLNQTAVPYHYTFTLPAFDTSKGTLQSVQFKLSDTTTVSVLVANMNLDTAETFTNAFADIPLSVTGPAGYSISDTISYSGVSGTVPGDGKVYAFTSPAQTSDVSETFSSGLSLYENGSPLTLTFSTDAKVGNYGGSSSENVLFGGAATAGGTFELVYNYAAVPEPATWAFLMLGVGAIGVAMRNRRKAGLALAAA